MTKLIISTDRPNLTDMQLDSRRKNFEYLLERLNVRSEVCEGSWEGVREQSYMITLDNSKHYRKLIDTALGLFDQDAVLKISSYGGATLIFPDKSEELIGELVEVNEVPTDGCYTQRFSDGAIFVIRDL
jgi:hypothetical protein